MVELFIQAWVSLIHINERKKRFSEIRFFCQNFVVCHDFHYTDCLYGMFQKFNFPTKISVTTFGMFIQHAKTVFFYFLKTCTQLTAVIPQQHKKSVLSYLQLKLEY